MTKLLGWDLHRHATPKGVGKRSYRWVRDKRRTIWMPHPAPDKFHGRGAQRIIFGELKLGSKDATLEWGPLGALDQGFPVEHVIFGYRACSDAIWRVRGEVFVLVEKALLGDAGCHICRLGKWVSSFTALCEKGTPRRKVGWGGSGGGEWGMRPRRGSWRTSSSRWV